MFTSIDLSKLDVSRLGDLDDRLVGAAREVAYVTIGFGVLAVQRAQVRRRELAKALDDHSGTIPVGGLVTLAKTFGKHAQGLVRSSL